MAALACGAGAAVAETITINGAKRTFSARLADVKPAPLVIALHGNTQTGADMASRTSWPAVAKREHFTVVFPDGLNRAWADLRSNEMRAGRTPPEGTDDVAFIAKLVETYVADGTADPRRVYVTGVSNGGAMTMTLACKRADLFAAAASVIMNFTDEFANACQPSRPVPMLMMNGTADPLIPYEGGRGTSRYAVDGFWSAEKTIAFWRKVNGCEEGDAAATDLADKDPNDQSTVTLDPRAARPGATPCSIASMTAATACPAAFRTPGLFGWSISSSARRTTTSTARRRSGRFSSGFRELATRVTQ